MESTVTGDDTWMQHFTLHKTYAETQWKHPDSTRQEIFKLCHPAERVTASALWDAGIIHVGPMPRGTAINVNAYYDTL
jgi:hypothetical protein